MMTFILSCKEEAADIKPIPNIKSINKIDISICTNQLQNGDIVLRTGNDVISGMFALLNRQNKTYSHCGIAFKEDSIWVVYHSIGGEDNPDQKMKRESLRQFISPFNNLGFGICHYELSNEQVNSLQKNVQTYYDQQVPFDMKFDLKSDDRLYCAEMIYKAFNKALGKQAFFTSTVHQGFEYVSTDNIFVNNKAQILCQIVY